MANLQKMSVRDETKEEVQSTANSDLQPQNVADSVESVVKGPLHGVGGQFVAIGGGQVVPVSET